MADIISGRYRGPLQRFRGKRALLLSEKRHTLTTGLPWHDTVLAQWDDIDMWEQTMCAKSQEEMEKLGGWSEHLFRDFSDFHLTSDVW